MPHSRALLSSMQISLASLWLLSGDFQIKFNKLKSNKAVLLFLIIFTVHILGLINTTDFHSAFKDIKIKLPLLLFPVIIGTSERLGFKELKFIILIFTASILLKSLYGIFSYFDLTGKEVNDIQNISGKFSHIRFSLMLNISVFSMIFLLIHDNIKKKFFIKTVYSIIIVCLIIIIILIHSVTGWIVFLLLTIFSLYYFIKNSKNKVLKLSSIFILFGTLIFIVLFFVLSLNKFTKTQTIDFSALDTHSKSGNIYYHDTLSTQKENEYFINIYLCEKELKEEWNKTSEFKYSGKDKKGQYIKYTLIRYLSSKGLRKDKEGIQSLNTQDIRNIENGLTNYIFENQIAIYPKLYEVFWQIKRYKGGGNPEGHSVTQRIEFIKTGIEIIKRKFWFGTGTGDLKKDYTEQYKISDTKLSEDYQLRAHNQYITFFITFGIIGFLLFLFSYFYLPFITKKFKDYLFMIVYILISLSMLNEDTLETQMGATMFAYFLCLYLFSEPLNMVAKQKTKLPKVK